MLPSVVYRIIAPVVVVLIVTVCVLVYVPLATLNTGDATVPPLCPVPNTSIALIFGLSTTPVSSMSNEPPVTTTE